ncbi:MAG: MOSC domain-containing protein [Chloroflexi bacterium]|nr:MOSC domain-containing protein [Chloroflexota bacterium]
MTAPVHPRHLVLSELEAGLPAIRLAPQDRGTLELIVRRPRPLEREVLDEGQLDLVQGLVGDSWRARGSSRMLDGAADPETQITLISARVIDLLAGSRDRWALAGDQLYIDLDLGGDNVPPGTRLAIGGATVEVTARPHTGCKQFAERFGLDAVRFVSTPLGRQSNLRGVNTRVVVAGTVRRGDIVRKV